MKLALFAYGQEDHVGIVEQDGIFDLSRAMQAYDLFNKNIQTSPVTSIHEMLDKNMVRPAVIEPVLDFIDRHNLRQALTVPAGAADHPLRAPIRRPGKIIALGGNYSFPGEPDPEEPPFFFKVATSVIGSDEPIIYKRIMKQVEPEIELAVVIGGRASDVPQQEAMQYVAGYTVLNDVTARDLQNAAWDIQRPWEYTKSIDTFTPVGPHLGPARSGERSTRPGDDHASQWRGRGRSQHQHDVVPDSLPDRVPQPVHDVGTGRHHCDGNAGPPGGAAPRRRD